MGVKLNVNIKGTVEVNPADYDLDPENYDEADLVSLVTSEFEDGVLDLEDLEVEPFEVSISEDTEG